MSWKYKEEWKKEGKNFVIIVSRHESEVVFDRGKYRWCIYAYIYPKHPRFNLIDKNGPMYQPACDDLPLHGGPSYFQSHLNNDGKITSYQIGCDYNHLHDNYFTFIATKEDATEIFSDAKILFNFLEEEDKCPAKQ